MGWFKKSDDWYMAHKMAPWYMAEKHNGMFGQVVKEIN